MSSGTPGFRIESGFPDEHRAGVAALFWQAFSSKLDRVLGLREKGLRFIERLLAPQYALSAMATDGRLLGVAGFKDRNGALVGGSLKDLTKFYGFLGGVWRGLLLEVLEREPKPGELLMDGIFVATEARGQGVGTALLEAICIEAGRRECTTVRLDVIDTNPRARALYERRGFKAQAVEKTGPFRVVFGFSSATRMVKSI